MKKAARKDWLVIAALGFLALVAMLAVFGPILAPYDYTAIFVGQPNEAPSAQHLFGTDSAGGDIFSRFLVAPASPVGPLVIVALSTLLGASLAIASAWFGGIVRGTLSRLIDVIFAIPGIVIAVLAVAMFERGMIARWLRCRSRMFRSSPGSRRPPRRAARQGRTFPLCACRVSRASPSASSTWCQP